VPGPRKDGISVTRRDKRAVVLMVDVEDLLVALCLVALLLLVDDRCAAGSSAGIDTFTFEGPGAGVEGPFRTREVFALCEEGFVVVGPSTVVRAVRTATASFAGSWIFIASVKTGNLT